MAVNIFKKEDQADGDFNSGEILEKKPIGFPQDNGILKPYSNIFYWAHAWTPRNNSTIGLHPHQGFEICSFVLKGNINHFDTKQNIWIPLSEGDVQIIRSGKGISHAEEIDRESEIFQIWFDPDISKSLKKEATYDDYSSSEFKVIDFDNKLKKIIKGDGSPVKMDSEGVFINEYFFRTGNHLLEIKEDFIHSYFILNGEIEYGKNILRKGTFFTVKKQNNFEFQSLIETRVFEIISPLNPKYKTYFMSN
jgi:redox-sensitive bicupin YhaK (pirin superfamily)